MEDRPYTTADEDPFNVQPYVQDAPAQVIQNKRSSMFDKWISDQQAQSQAHLSEPIKPLPPSLPSSSHAYLAYPELNRPWLSSPVVAEDSDVASIDSYDLVDDDDIPCEEQPQAAPSTPIPKRTLKSSRHSITPSFKTISRTFRSASPSSSPSANVDTATRVLAKLSLFPPRTPRSSTDPALVANLNMTPRHRRNPSQSTLSHTTPQLPTNIVLNSPPAKWRPSVLGHFNQSSTSQISVGASEPNYIPRPSISSADTYATSAASRTTTTFESNIPSTPSMLSLFDSIRLRNNKSPKSSSRFSVTSSSSPGRASTSVSGRDESDCNGAQRCSKESSTSHRVPFAPLSSLNLNNIDDDEDDLEPPPTYHFPKHESTRTYTTPSSTVSLKGTKFSSLSSRGHRKKKKLIISGVGVAEVRKFEGIKRWCESFGDIRQIMRMPNGDLQIDFRDPEVADTVCRVRAKVFIAGVGSVQLSWIAGKR